MRMRWPRVTVSVRSSRSANLARATGLTTCPSLADVELAHLPGCGLEGVVRLDTLDIPGHDLFDQHADFLHQANYLSALGRRVKVGAKLVPCAPQPDGPDRRLVRDAGERGPPDQCLHVNGVDRQEMGSTMVGLDGAWQRTGSARSGRRSCPRV